MKSLDDKIASMKRLIKWCPRDYTSGIAFNRIGLQFGGKPEAELSVEATIREAFNLYFKNFLVLLAPVLVTYLIAGVLTEVIRTYAPTVPQMPASAAVLISWFIALVERTLLIGVISFVVSTIAYSAVIKYSSALLQGNKISLGSALSFAAAKSPSLLAASILISILSCLGLIALIAPGIIMYVMFSLTTEVIIIENMGAKAGMSRSRALVSHRWLKTFTLFLILGIIGLPVSFVVPLIVGPLGGYGWILSSMAGALTAPLTPVAFTIYYYSMNAKDVAVMSPVKQEGNKVIVERLSTAFVLSLIGGLFVLFAGLMIMRLGSVLNPIVGRGGIIGIGLLGALCGIFMILGGVMLYARPQQHKIWGGVVLVFSFVSLFSAFGGLLVGLILGFIGGIWGIEWESSATQEAFTRTCPNCGVVIEASVLNAGARFCPHCGKELPREKATHTPFFFQT